MTVGVKYNYVPNCFNLDSQPSPFSVNGKSTLKTPSCRHKEILALLTNVKIVTVDSNDVCVSNTLK